MSPFTPHARQERLILHDLSEELLVYDLERHKVSCLNQMAMLTWRHCDGRSTVPEIAQALEAELGITVDERAVWLALERLSRAHLLRAPVTLPSWTEGYSRREWAASVAKASAVLVPAVASILSPTAAAAMTNPITTGACSLRTPASRTPPCGETLCTDGDICKLSGGGNCDCDPP